jgi:flagellar hook-associated protein 2
VTVSNLAVAQKLASPEYAQGASYVPSNSPGTLTFTQNGVSFTISDTQGKTLAELRDAINAAPDNTGVTASIMNTGGGARLILSADQTGLANAITVSGTGNINQFANDLTELIPAEDASAVIDGIPITSSTNTLTGIIDGVTITLLKESATPVGMTVAYDAVGAKDKITKLVTDYNNFVDTAKKLRSYDTSSRAAGPLIGDSGLRNLEAALRREMTAVTPSAPVGMDSILALGFKFGNDGKLSVNETILADKLATDLDKITQIFSATDGLAARLRPIRSTIANATFRRARRRPRRAWPSSRNATERSSWHLIACWRKCRVRAPTCRSSPRKNRPASPLNVNPLPRAS